MRVFIGTSGFGYREWKGSFYPVTIKSAAMLGFYAERLSSVEINNSFYKMPTREVLGEWASRVPAGFTFVLKAPQEITHWKRLKAVTKPVKEFVAVSQDLGKKLGPMLFQLPPNFKKDLPRLRRFLTNLVRIPKVPRIAFEFRHDSWVDDDVYALLRSHRVALCTAETDEITQDLERPLVATADWGYLRLRRTDYAERDLRSWVERIRAQKWSAVYVFMKHEDEGKGPQFAMRLRALMEASPQLGSPRTSRL